MADYYDEDYSIDEEELDYERALERARTASDVAEQMRAEEEAIMTMLGSLGLPEARDEAPASPIAPRPSISPGIPLPPDVGGGMPLPAEAPVQSAPWDPAASYRFIAGSEGRGPEANAAWEALVASGETPSTAVVYPPSQPTLERPLIRLPQTIDPEGEAARMKFEASRMYNFLVNNGMPPQEAMQQAGMQMFMPQSAQVQKPMTAYQEAQVARWKQPAQMTPWQQAQVERQNRMDSLKYGQAPRAILDEYKTLLQTDRDIVRAVNDQKLDPSEGARQRRAIQLRIEKLKTDYPSLVAQPAMPELSASPSAKQAEGSWLRRGKEIFQVRNGVPVKVR